MNSSKRKEIDELLSETCTPRKRLKISEILQDNLVQEELNETQFSKNSIKRRIKLLTAMHLKKRYKYYCKKHNTTYLLENARQKIKESSKESRNNFIQRFRILNISTSSRDFSENQNHGCTLNINNDILKGNQVNANEDNSKFEEDPFVKSISPTHTAVKENSVENNIIFEESDDSDFDDHYDETHFKKRKIVKCLIVKKNPNSNDIIFSEDEDYSESDFDDGNSDCDCYYHENIRNHYHDYEYDSSSDEEVKSLFNTLCTA